MLANQCQLFVFLGIFFAFPYQRDFSFVLPTPNAFKYVGLSLLFIQKRSSKAIVAVQSFLMESYVSSTILSSHIQLLIS